MPSGWSAEKYAGIPTTVTFNNALKALGVDPNSAAANLIGPVHAQERAGAMWDAANKARGTDNDEGAGKYKNFDQLWNGVLKDDPRIPAKAKAALGDLLH